jgi:phosphocarrier protein HPr
MQQNSAKRDVVVTNRDGLHLRPAHLFAKLAATFDSEIQLVRDGEAVDGKSILSIITLAAAQGTRLTLRAEGPDAEVAVTALEQLFQRGFGESAVTDVNVPTTNTEHSPVDR